MQLRPGSQRGHPRNGNDLATSHEPEEAGADGIAGQKGQAIPMAAREAMKELIKSLNHFNRCLKGGLSRKQFPLGKKPVLQLSRGQGQKAKEEREAIHMGVLILV